MAILVVVLAVAFLQPVRVRVASAAVLADALDLPMVRPFAAEVDRQPATFGGVDGDLYDPGSGAPAIVLIPGATPAGTDDARAVALADAMARADRAVFVPELEVYDQDVVRADVDRLVRVAAALADERDAPVVLLGFSFGGSLGLLAAADDHLDDRVALAAVFGAYFDLTGVLQAATTGEGVVDGQVIAWDPAPEADDIVRERLLEMLPVEMRDPVEQALAGERDPATLAGPARAAVELLTNDDPHRTFALVEALPDTVRDRLREVSPSSVAGALDVPVVAMHATDDPAVPYAELLRLEAAVPHARTITVGSFEHVDFRLGAPREWPRVGADLWRVWSFATDVLDAQDTWWP